MANELNIPPHSLEAEHAVLGCLLANAEQTADLVFNLLKEKDFYLNNHQLVFRSIKDLYEKRQAVDILTVNDHLDRLKLSDQIGGREFLAELANNTPDAGNAEAYASLVREKSVHRQLIEVGVQISKLGYYPETDSTQSLVDEAEKKIFEISQEQTTNSFVDLKTAVTQVSTKLDELSKVVGSLTGFATGFSRLDAMTSGFQRGDLIIIAGRPSMGKTALATNIAEYISAHKGDYILAGKKIDPVVAFFSMEMGAEQLTMRMLASTGSIEFNHIRSAKLSKHEWTKLIEAGDLLRRRQFLIDDKTGISIHTLRGKIRRLKKDCPGLGLVIIDYLQLLTIEGRQENRNTEVTKITRILKEMAREVDVPVVVLSQLNRMIESRSKPRPVLSDLRESGSIEQDADVIIFVHREELFNPEEENLKGRATLYVAKQRNGETGDIDLRFEGRFSRFDNPLEERQIEQFAHLSH